jgi:PBSX family phage terminase large subunit
MTVISSAIDKFKKTVTQSEAIKAIVTSVATIFCLFGGSRSGKSFIIMYIIIVRACKCKSDHLIVRETFSSAKTSIWQKTLPDVLRICFPNLPVKYNNTDYFCTLPNGSTIKIAGLDDNKKVERLLGTEYSTIWANEANQVTYSALNKLRTRLAQKNMLKKMTYLDLNPTNTSSWVYQLVEEKINPQDGEALDDPRDCQSFQMNVGGNLENIDEEYVKMLEKLPKEERDRFLLGEYKKDNSGKAVYAFSREEHVSDIAVKQPGTIRVGTDFNYLYNSDVLCSQTANNLYVWDELQIEGDTFKKCDELKKKGATGAMITCDSTGKARRTSGISDHQILKDNHFQLDYRTNPAVKDKIANLNRCFSMGIIKIHPRCKKLIRDLTQLVWDKNEQLDQKTDPSLSHLVDGLAYLCWALYPMIEKKKSRRLM